MEGSFLCNALTTLFVLLQFTTYMDSCVATRTTLIPNKANTEYIKKSCGITTYPKLCYNSLSIYANKIQSSPKRLATTALTVTLSAARSASGLIKNISKNRDLRPREAAAVADCVNELGDSVEELRRSLEEMAHIGEGSNFELQMSDIQTWVSAALTNDDTCMDGFAGEGMDGQVKTTIRGKVLKVAHLTSNTLALVNNYAAAAHSPHRISP